MFYVFVCAICHFLKSDRKKKKTKNSMSLVQGGLGKADFPLSLCDMVSRRTVPGDRALS